MNKHSLMLFPLEIAIPAEARWTVSVFRKFYHRLSFTIRRPDHLAQELHARGVIDESIVVSACVCLLIDLACSHMFIPTLQQVAAQKGERLTRARLLLNAVERKIASERGREVLREFLRALMRDRHLRFLGEELALAANIVQGKCAFSNAVFCGVCITTMVVYIYIDFQSLCTKLLSMHFRN